MFRVILYNQWKWSRLLVVLGSVAGFALPIVSLQGAARADASPLAPAELLRTVQSWGVLYPVLAATLGLLVAITTWTPDHRGRHVYALVLPVPRWRYVLLRFGAGALLLAAPITAVLVGALVATSSAAIPAGLQGYPVALAVRFALAVLVAFAGFFAVSAATARADSLAREWRHATAVADAIDSLERARVFVGRDTIRVGALTIVTNASPLPLREAAARAWPLIDSVYGDDARQLEERPYVIVPVDPDTSVERPPWHSDTEIPWDQDVTSLTLLLLSTVPIAPADTALQGWLGGPVRPLIHADLERADVYVRLVTAPSEASRRCLIGDIGACRDALDLFGRGDRLTRWYPSARERRSLLKTFTPYYFDRGAQQPMLRACAEGSDSACTELLRSLPPDALPRPLTYDARATLVGDALRLGGRAAYHRLVASAGLPIADRLAAAGGIAIDPLLAQWRAEILAARPVPVSLPPRGIWIALGWTILFAFCGLRSSRWRVS